MTSKGLKRTFTFLARWAILANLATFPTMGKSYSQIRSDLRGIPLQGYIILYRLIDDGLEIVRVVNARQDLESLFDEEEEE
jgi:toxin ParE1/3/4